MDEFKKRGIDDVIKETLDKIGDNPIYITFDLDSLDASVAPAVSNIEPSFTGFTIDEAKALIQSVKNKNVNWWRRSMFNANKRSEKIILPQWLLLLLCLRLLVLIAYKE